MNFKIKDIEEEQYKSEVLIGIRDYLKERNKNCKYLTPGSKRQSPDFKKFKKYCFDLLFQLDNYEMLILELKIKHKSEHKLKYFTDNDYYQPIKQLISYKKIENYGIPIKYCINDCPPEIEKKNNPYEDLKLSKIISPKFINEYGKINNFDSEKTLNIYIDNLLTQKSDSGKLLEKLLLENKIFKIDNFNNKLLLLLYNKKTSELEIKDSDFIAKMFKLMEIFIEKTKETENDPNKIMDKVISLFSTTFDENVEEIENQNHNDEYERN